MTLEEQLKRTEAQKKHLEQAIKALDVIEKSGLPKEAFEKALGIQNKPCNCLEKLAPFIKPKEANPLDPLDPWRKKWECDAMERVKSHMQEIIGKRIHDRREYRQMEKFRNQIEGWA